MQINVSQQLKSSIGEVRDYEIDGIINLDDNNITVQGKVSLIRTDRGVLAKGTLPSATELTCGRCLNLFNHHFSLNIEEEFFSVTDVNTGAAISLPDEPGYFTINENNVLDLTDAVRQYALMAIPIKPLCHQDCAGLCPACGANLNKAPCGCPSKPVDPRWDELRKLVSTNGITSANKEKGT